MVRHSASLTAKTVLLLCPNFYSYKDLIIREIENHGAQVIYFENKMFSEDWRCSTFLPLSFVKYCRNPRYKSKYIKDLLAKITGISIDYLLAINGFCVTETLIRELKKRNPTIKTSLFLWDSLCYWKYSHIIPLFDNKFSFDHIDCGKYKDYGLKYLPDFFVNNNNYINNYKNIYDVVHIGSVSIYSSDRIKILNDIQNECDAKGLKSYIKVVTILPKDIEKNKLRYLLLFLLSHKYRKLIYNLYKYRHSKILTSTSLSIDQVHEIEASSKVIVDIPPSKQAGLTIRTLEALNRGQKLITTNHSIYKDLFYSSNNVCVINKDSSPKIDTLFLVRPCEQINIDYLHISKWILTVLC